MVKIELVSLFTLEVESEGGVDTQLTYGGSVGVGAGDGMAEAAADFFLLQPSNRLKLNESLLLVSQ